MFNQRISKFMFISTFLLVCFNLSFAVIKGSAVRRDLGKPATDLEAKLILYKDQYLLREPIWIKITVTNKGEDEGWFYFARVTGFKIKDSKGEVYPCHVSFSTSGATVIKPGETLEDETNLLLWYGLPENKFNFRRYLPPGEYTIYHQLNENIKSKVRHFEIVQPKSDELKAMKLLKDSYNLVIEKKTNDAIDKLHQLITKFPQSVYAPHALWEMAGKYRIFIKDIQKTKETYHKLVDNYPHSREAIDALSDLVNSYIAQKDQASCVSYLNNLIEKHPNKDIAREAEKQLEKIKEKEFK